MRSHSNRFLSKLQTRLLPQLGVHRVARNHATLNTPLVKQMILHSHQISTSFHSIFCNQPKGFGNFFNKKGDKNRPPKPKAPETDDNPSSEPDSAGKPIYSTEKTSAKASSSEEETPEEEDDEPKKDKKNDKKPNQGFQTQWLYLLIPLFLIAVPAILNLTADENEITWHQFKTQLLEQGRVERIEVVNKTKAKVWLRKENSKEGDDFSYSSVGSGSGIRSQYSSDKVYWWEIGSVDTFETKLDQARVAMGVKTEDWVPVSYVSEVSWRDVLLKGPLLYLLLFAWAAWFFNRRATELFEAPMKGGGRGGMGGGIGNIFNITKANVTVINKGEKVKTRFKDVAGLQHAKDEVMEFVEFLKDPARYTKLGAKIPNGALLVGPPGTGKTLLAKAVAGEAECPFFSISGSDFIEMFVGVGPSRVRDLFAQARANAPCIVFIDEIDAVGRKRGKGGWGGGNDERENTLNQLLVEMDGFTTSTNIVILAGTNRADILDNALTRPGRFDRTIQVDKPDIKGRIEIFKVHLSKLKLAIPIADVAQRMATLTPGMTGADIANVANEAALRAARLGKKAVEMEDFYGANDRVVGGIEKRIVMSTHERNMIAYHEAGHAVAGWFLEHADPLLKVTIIPRGGGALGFAQYLPKELQMYTAEQLMDMMCMTLGGRASEQIFFKRVSTGAADDLNKVTKLAYGQIAIYGMDEGIGNLSFPPEDGEGLKAYKPYSEATAVMMDQAAMKMVKDAYARTIELLTSKKTYVDKLAKLLLEKETIGHDEIVGVLGHRPFSTDAYREYLTNTKEFAEKHEDSATKKANTKTEDESSKASSEGSK